jgi:hypothetical protein
MLTKSETIMEKPREQPDLDIIAELTGMTFCDEDCGCGENSQLWFTPTPCGWVPDWLPGWMNGCDTDEIWNWLVENGRTKAESEMTETDDDDIDAEMREDVDMCEHGHPLGDCDLCVQDLEEGEIDD